MRDPARISKVLENLRAVWLTNSDLRLGQLITIAHDKAWEGEPKWRGAPPDLFNTEDYLLDAGLRRLLIERGE